MQLPINFSDIAYLLLSVSFSHKTQRKKEFGKWMPPVHAM